MYDFKLFVDLPRVFEQPIELAPLGNRNLHFYLWNSLARDSPDDFLDCSSCDMLKKLNKKLTKCKLHSYMNFNHKSTKTDEKRRK